MIPMVVEMSKSKNIRELAAVFKALSDPNRLAILEMLREQCGGECELDAEGSTVSEVASCCDVGLSTVSHHLKELRRAGLVDCVRRGQRVCCTPNREALAAVEAFLRG